MRTGRKGRGSKKNFCCTRGDPKSPELSSGGQALVVQASLIGQCSRNLSVSVHQLVLLWVAAFSFSEFFLEDSVSLPISWWVIYEHTGPHHAEWSAVFDQKRMTLVTPPSLFTQDHPEQPFFCLFPLDEKSPQREMFCRCERGKTKNSRSFKRHQNQQVQKRFWAVRKKGLDMCIASNGECFEGDWSLNK